MNETIQEETQSVKAIVSRSSELSIWNVESRQNGYFQDYKTRSFLVDCLVGVGYSYYVSYAFIVLLYDLITYSFLVIDIDILDHLINLFDLKSNNNYVV